MRIGLIDVDGHNFPNLVLMKLSAWHKLKQDTVEWYTPLKGHFDKVYMSKVFSFTPDYVFKIDADVVERGGSGYCISIDANGKEFFDKSKHKELPYEVEHIYPDYSLYNITDTAYGFLTRGCPRGCDFCIVKDKEGLCSNKVADLKEFWNGQPYIELLDPNILASKDCKDLLQQLIDSNAWVNFNQGLDIRLMTDEKAKLLSQVKVHKIHFAWDRYEDKDIIQPKFLQFRQQSKINPHDLQVYVLCGDREKRVRDEDLERIYWLRDNGFAPYVMLYDKEHIERGHELHSLQRYVNSRAIFYSIKSFDEYTVKQHVSKSRRLF